MYNLLINETGDFFNGHSIPSNSPLRTASYGYLPIILLDKLYDISLDCIRCKKPNIDLADTSAEFIDVGTIIDKVKIYNIVTDIDTAICTNIDNGIVKPVKVHINAEKFINRFSGKHFRYRHEQLDCTNMVLSLSSELALFSNSNELDVNFEFNRTYTLRMTERPKPKLLPDELTGLRRLKGILNELYENIKLLMYRLQQRFYDINSLIVNNTNSLEFEL